jgi:hypothetical protein
MTTTADALPDDIGALRALILTERAEREQLAERNALLERLNTKLEQQEKVVGEPSARRGHGAFTRICHFRRLSFPSAAV